MFVSKGVWALGNWCCTDRLFKAQTPKWTYSAIKIHGLYSLHQKKVYTWRMAEYSESRGARLILGDPPYSLWSWSKVGQVPLEKFKRWRHREQKSQSTSVLESCKILEIPIFPGFCNFSELTLTQTFAPCVAIPWIFPTGLGPPLTNSIGSMGDSLELIWPHWILSTRPFRNVFKRFYTVIVLLGQPVKVSNLD